MITRVLTGMWTATARTATSCFVACRRISLAIPRGLGPNPDSIALAEAMLREAGVACTPGVDFDQQQGHKFMRLSFAGSTADMKEASRRIGDWLPNYLKSR